MIILDKRGQLIRITSRGDGTTITQLPTTHQKCERCGWKVAALLGPHGSLPTTCLCGGRLSQPTIAELRKAGLA